MKLSQTASCFSQHLPEKFLQLSLGGRNEAYITAISVPPSSEWISFWEGGGKGRTQEIFLRGGCWSALSKGDFGATLHYQVFLPLVFMWTERNGVAPSTCTPTIPVSAAHFP